MFIVHGSGCGRCDQYEILENWIIGCKQTVLYSTGELKVVCVNNAKTASSGMLDASKSNNLQLKRS